MRHLEPTGSRTHLEVKKVVTRTRLAMNGSRILRRMKATSTGTYSIPTATIQMLVQPVTSSTDRTIFRRRIKAMGAISETKPGGEMVCILGFSARARGLDNQPIPGGRRSFQVGERVRYVAFFYKDTPPDNPTGYMAVFEPLHSEDKNRYAATQDYFVSLDCWEGLREHFASTPTAVAGTHSIGARTRKVSSKRAAAKISAPPVLPQTTSAPNRGKGARKNA